MRTQFDTFINKLDKIELTSTFGNKITGFIKTDVPVTLTISHSIAAGMYDGAAMPVLTSIKIDADCLVIGIHTSQTQSEVVAMNTWWLLSKQAAAGSMRSIEQARWADRMREAWESL